MAEFLKSVGNLFVIGVTILGAIAIFFNVLEPLTALALLFILFIGFISLIIYQINKIEKEINSLKERYERSDELIEIKGDIKLIKDKMYNKR